MRGFARLIASTPPELTISRTTTGSGRHRLVAKGSSPALIERLILSDFQCDCAALPTRRAGFE